MWSKLTLRMRITILTMFALLLVTASITALSNYNAQRNFVIPLERLGLDESDIKITPRLDGANGEITTSFAINELTMIQDITRISQSDFRNYSMIIAAVFVLIGTALAYFISGQTLKPIKSLTEKIEEIDANNLGTQIKPPKSNDETARLTHTFNNMLGKLSRSFENQKLFAQNAAHELKTPLASIMTNIEVLQMDDEPTTEEYKEVIDTVKASTKQLIKLVQGLLSINSIIDETSWRTFSVKEVIEKIIGGLEDDIKEKGIFVKISGESHLKGDKALLERAFSNLVHNAVRYNVDNGTISITLSNDGIIIEDSGVGIPEEDLAHIFEPFYVVDKSRTKHLGGHGLGMAIAKSIFDKHKMKINISGEPGQGTKIFLEK